MPVLAVRREAAEFEGDRRALLPDAAADLKRSSLNCCRTSSGRRGWRIGNSTSTSGSDRKATCTQMHYDRDENFLAELRGRKHLAPVRSGTDRVPLSVSEGLGDVLSQLRGLRQPGFRHAIRSSARRVPWKASVWSRGHAVSPRRDGGTRCARSSTRFPVNFWWNPGPGTGADVAATASWSRIRSRSDRNTSSASRCRPATS